MTGPEHYREAERLAERADEVMDAEYGIYASMGGQERIQRRMAYLAEAQVHATLALAAATALNDFRGWCAVAIKPERPEAAS